MSAVFTDYQDKGLFLAVTAATSIAFFAMVGFEDSVNMVEETQNPERIFPRTMLTGLGIAVILYMLVASRLIYGMARQNVLPRPLGKVLPGRRTPWAGILFSTILALGLIWYVTSDPDSNVVANLSGTTAFLLLCVFTVVNVACVVLRGKRDLNRKVFFTSPGPLPIVAALLCAFLAGPWVGRDAIQYQIAGGGLMAIGVVLWFITWLINRMTNTGPDEPVGMQNIGKDDQVPPPSPGH